MLVLSRKLNEKIYIGDGITITVVELLPDRVKLGIDAPPTVSVFRSELLQRPPVPKKETQDNGLERPAT